MSDQDYAISIQAGYVLVESPPNYNVVWEDQPPMLRAVSAACDKAGARKVLLRGPKTNVKLTPSQVFKLGEEIAKLNLMFAIVQLHDAPREKEELLENTAGNRGSVIQFFDSEQEAKDWLGV